MDSMKQNCVPGNMNEPRICDVSTTIQGKPGQGLTWVQLWITNLGQSCVGYLSTVFKRQVGEKL